MNLDWRRHYPAPVRFDAARHPAHEYLDDPANPAADRDASHRDLTNLERWPFQFSPIESAAVALLRGLDMTRPIEILELGAGSGHTGTRLAGALGRRGWRIVLTQTDLLPRGGAIERLDWLVDPVPPCDLVLANLVIHHFGDEAARRALGNAGAAARIGGIVFDLNRHPAFFHFIRLVFPLVVESPMTVADGLISVQQSFTREELLDLARRAGLPKPVVTTHLVARNRLTWRRGDRVA